MTPLSINDDDNCACPSATKLNGFAQGQLDTDATKEVREHLRTCTSCAETVDALERMPEPVITPTMADRWQKLALEQARALSRVLTTPPPSHLEAGQIWTTLAPRTGQVGSARMVVLLDIASTVISAAAASLDLEQQTDQDVCIWTHESPLGYAFMVEMWNPLQPHRSQLNRYLGRLGPEPMRAIAVFNLEADSQVGDRLGPPMYGDADPRREFRETELAECQFLRRSSAVIEPVTATVVALNGPSLRAHRQANRVTFTGLGEALIGQGFTEQDVAALADAERSTAQQVSAQLLDAVATILRTTAASLTSDTGGILESESARLAFAESDRFKNLVIQRAIVEGADAIQCFQLAKSEWRLAAAREPSGDVTGQHMETWLALLEALIPRVIEKVQRNRS